MPEAPTAREADTAPDRVRWHCRRGLLELDLVLGRFLERDWPALDAVQRAAFVALLALPDNDLWDLASGRRDDFPPDAAPVVARLRAP